ncbi:NAD(P)/FAD-dependent oxidoreductase [Dyadobacter sp. LJ53]|uniref:NAD(P)/FAD-dependent oxidoreductase n=1 Tax=Dyadobacter chenwenxiniae TaxID=2906456 RepID=UPI001F1F6DBE|nr:NAD(P)/FAD-dependent oxidoreductase [Dyadobacter chenwenxiniae]MCF0051634.1 NAD(P)/FAD-dependent oxidoreductase [Dyadobacter chenwenxiniae]
MNALIIGAGPAGTSCAIQLLKAGIEVTILDKQHFPRSAPGETLHPGIEPLLKELDIWKEIEGFSFKRHPGIITEFRDSAKLDLYNQEGCWEGFQFPRDTFDQLLLDQAISLGAKFYSGSKITDVTLSSIGIATVFTNSGSFNASFFIDASGRNAVLPKKLGIRYKQQSTPLFVHFGYVESENTHSFLTPRMIWDADGWIWVSRISEKLISWNRLYPFNQKIAKNWLPECLQHLKPAGSHKAADVTWRIAENVSRSNYFLIGDAAFTFDPASSKGVLKAIMSGMMCGYLLGQLKLVKSDIKEIHAHYNTWMNDWFSNDLANMKNMYAEKGFPI